MISKIIIDLLIDEDNNIPDSKPKIRIDDTFILNKDNDKSKNIEKILSTKKKLGIIEWFSVDRQLRSYGKSRIEHVIKEFIDDEAKKHINTDNKTSFNFGSDSIPFAVKYNVAVALTLSEAINMLSGNEECEIYASKEIRRIFKKYNKYIDPGLNKVNFGNFPLKMKKELIWPMVQNLHRCIKIRKAAQIFPEGISGEIAYQALLSESGNDQLSCELSPLDALKYSDKERIFFSELSDIEAKYQIASYSLNHIGDIKPKKKAEESTPDKEQEKIQDEDKIKKEKEYRDNVKKIEEEYISAFKRLNKNKSFWEKINLDDLSKMGQDVITAVKEEIRNFALLKQKITYRLFGQSKIAIENEEYARIIYNQNPDFAFASRYFSMFFQPSDYYSILGLDNTKEITEKQVKDAFKRKAKIYHPDKNSDAPDKEQKEQYFKLLIEAKDSVIRKIKSGKNDANVFKEDSSMINYLGNISRLFNNTSNKPDKNAGKQKKIKLLDNINTVEENEMESDFKYMEGLSNPYEDHDNLEQDELNQNQVTDKPENQKIDTAWNSENYEDEENSSYLGPYFEEIRILESMLDSWSGKKILVMGVGREPEEFSVPIILAKLGAEVSAADINYSGPSEYGGCKYYRISVDRIDEAFVEEYFDVVITTAMFGVPFTNWSAREHNLNTFDPGFKEKIKELELEAIKKMVSITKKNGLHLHYNKDMNPQSWNFGEEELKSIGCEQAFKVEELMEPDKTWYLKI
ncbi:DnaJ domain-containing protein [Candidatus Poribacteria bacterium]|nr:DnaJ domain-containing protein [Candidatus Poribacteria bacterium]